MKTVVIKNHSTFFDKDEYNNDILELISDHNILESNIVYFSAGDCKIKEILVKREPFYSV